MYPRNLTPILREALADRPVVLLNGARQVGKSTLVQSLAEGDETQYFTLDDATQEIDLLLEEPAGRVAGIEVKMGGTVQEKDVRVLQELADALGDRFARGVVLYTGERAVPFSEKIFALPVQALWRTPA